MERKTILFFDRSELTDLYIKVGKYLSERTDIVHVAFSTKEANKLREAGINNFILYSEIFANILGTAEIDNDLLKEIDDVIISNSEGRFTLNSSIQSDRGYSLLTYKEALLSAQSHYKVWKYIFEQKKVDLFFHEPCSLFFNHIAALLCKKQGGVYTYQIQVHPEQEGYYYLFAAHDDFSCPEIEYWYNYYISNYEEVDIERAKRFIDKFRQDFSVLFGDVKHAKAPYFELLLKAIKTKMVQVKNYKSYDRIKDNIDFWGLTQNAPLTRLKNAINYKRRHLHFFRTIPSDEKYFYYSFHLEPEAVVLYLGDGIYKNQIKLIENIAAAMPPGYYLYVKDHPHEFAYRNAEDYERLLSIPNIRLFDSQIPGKILIKNATGVFTINGTAGFEALLLGKQVYCLGRNQYSFVSLVNYVKNIRDLRSVLYSKLNTEYDLYSKELLAYVNAFLKSSHKGYVNFFDGTANVYCDNQEDNAKIIAEDIVAYVNKLEDYK